MKVVNYFHVRLLLYRPKMKLHYVLTLLLFQTHLTLFLQWNTKGKILKDYTDYPSVRL